MDSQYAFSAYALRTRTVLRLLATLLSSPAFSPVFVSSGDLRQQQTCPAQYVQHNNPNVAHVNHSRSRLQACSILAVAQNAHPKPLLLRCSRTRDPSGDVSGLSKAKSRFARLQHKLFFVRLDLRSTIAFSVSKDPRSVQQDYERSPVGGQDGVRCEGLDWTPRACVLAPAARGGAA